MSIPTSLIYMGISTAVFVVVALLTLRSIGKERSISKMTPIFSIIIQIIFLAVYTVLTGMNFSSLLFLPALAIGLVVGVAVGGASQVYKKEDQVYTKRRKVFFLFWILTVVLNQALISFGIFQGIALTIFSTGNMVGSEGNTLFKIGRAKPINGNPEIQTKTLPIQAEKRENSNLCQNCRNAIKPNQKFCTNCGQRLQS